MHQCEVIERSQEPKRLPIWATQSGVGANEGLLGRIFRIGRVAEEPVGEAIGGALVAIDQRHEGGGIARYGAQDELIVGVIGKRRSGYTEEDACVVEWGTNCSRQGTLHAC